MISGNSVCPARLVNFTAAASCSKTVTARVARVDLFTKQLQSTSLFILQLTKAIIDKFRTRRNLPQPENLNEWRVLLVNVRSDLESYNIFYNRMNDRYKFLGDIIILALDAHATLVGLQDVVQKIEEPLHSLWLFLLRLVYIKPFIVIRDDDERGSAVDTVSSSLENFIAENIAFKFPTAFSLSEHMHQNSISPDSKDDSGDWDEVIAAVDIVGIPENSVGPPQQSITAPQPLLPILSIKIGNR